MNSLKIINNLKRLYLLRPIARSVQSTGCNSGDKKYPENPDLIPIIDYEDPKELPLPVYPEKINEKLETRKSRLLYQSRKRGMLENDLLLSSFASLYLQSFNAEQTALYDKLINEPTNDWDIYYWAIGVKPTPPEYENEIMELFRKHVSNPKRESRIRQPDL